MNHYNHVPANKTHFIRLKNTKSNQVEKLFEIESIFFVYMKKKITYIKLNFRQLSLSSLKF
jgi:hypothetical protein